MRVGKTQEDYGGSLMSQIVWLTVLFVTLYVALLIVGVMYLDKGE